jgi:hypothetical protein
VDVIIGNAEVGALSVGIGIALGIHPSGVLPAGFSPQTKDVRAMALVLPQRGSGGKTTSGTIVWGAGLEQMVEGAALGSSSRGRPEMEPVMTPKQRQREEETDDEQEHERRKSHMKPRCWK